MPTPLAEPAQLLFDRWYIVKSGEPSLAWTGRAWSHHVRGVPTTHYQLCNFTTRADALRFIDRTPALNPEPEP